MAPLAPRQSPAPGPGKQGCGQLRLLRRGMAEEGLEPERQSAMQA
jgi:hypothetical protein